MIFLTDTTCFVLTRYNKYKYRYDTTYPLFLLTQPNKQSSSYKNNKVGGTVIVVSVCVRVESLRGPSLEPVVALSSLEFNHCSNGLFLSPQTHPFPLFKVSLCKRSSDLGKGREVVLSSDWFRFLVSCAIRRVFFVKYQPR
ncbi:hypothetical protein VNO78_32740 [Psophocarpus tetragonolobus]|uniref:Uncharacterized protein n=1 Tax=Psophocarpus tetragonolobus TaxID=3891 RepID=A0AAN9NVQ0_PSOTE